MKANARSGEKRRVRPTLLILLWIWAACTFLVVDLFRNVPGFDAIRPRAKIYRSMRFAAHKMVDEPYLDSDFTVPGPPPPLTAEEAYMLQVNAGLAERENEWQDPEIGEFIKLGKLFGPGAEKALSSVVLDVAREEVVRAQAARLLGVVGPSALPKMREFIDSGKLPEAVRAAAVLGLGEVNTGPAAELALPLAADEESPFQDAALSAIDHMDSAAASRAILRVAQDWKQPAAVRVVACRSLAGFPNDENLEALTLILRDAEAAPELRCAAAAGLGRAGLQEAYGTLAAACSDATTEVARAAESARKKLAPWRTE